MAAKYIQKFASTAAFLAAAPDNGNASGIGEVSGVLYANVGGAAYRVQDGRRPQITPTAAVSLTADQSGSDVLLNAAAGFAITLPAKAAGLNFRVMVSALFATSNFQVIVPAADDNLIYGGAIVNSVFVPADVEGAVNFVATAETIGDFVEFYCDGSRWLVAGVGAGAGSITFTT